MKRQLVAACVALVLATVLMPSADASRDWKWSEKWSEWSTPVNLGQFINSESNDAGPAISKDGLSLYFQSQRFGGFGDADIYVARRESVDLPWEWPVNLGETINTDAFEGFAALSRDEHHLFFVRPSAPGLGDVWVSYRKDVHHDLGESGWETPTLLGPAVNTAAGDFGPSFFEDRKGGLPQLYFHSNRPGGLGGADIYVADAFGPAVLVQQLSSPQGDADPAISRNGLEVFFHSDRPGGAGAVDLWVSVRDSVFDPWSPPVNLGTTVNSPFSDLAPAISSDRETLFFTSNRPGFGLNDIYVTTRSRHGRN